MWEFDRCSLCEIDEEKKGGVIEGIRGGGGGGWWDLYGMERKVVLKQVTGNGDRGEKGHMKEGESQGSTTLPSNGLWFASHFYLSFKFTEVIKLVLVTRTKDIKCNLDPMWLCCVDLKT